MATPIRTVDCALAEGRLNLGELRLRKGTSPSIRFRFVGPGGAPADVSAYRLLLRAMTIDDLEREVEAAALALCEAEEVVRDLRQQLDAALRRRTRLPGTRALRDALSRALRPAELEAAACRRRRDLACEALEMVRVATAGRRRAA